MMSKATSYFKTRVESALHRFIAETNIPSSRVKDTILYTLFPGGKRLRPMLVYKTGEYFELEEDLLDILAVGIELIHAYSLIHDDLPAMDNDDFRRGKPSCHRAFDEATAILAGDGLQSLALDIVLTHLPRFISHEKVVKASLALIQASGVSGMVSGQSLDLVELSQAEITDTRLREIHALKTGKLFIACIEMVLATATPTHLESTGLIQFATHLGLAFQMQDDFLDQYSQRTGKYRSSDLENQKTTFANLYSKEVLFNLISECFYQSENNLIILGAKSSGLIRLIEEMNILGEFKCA